MGHFNVFICFLCFFLFSKGRREPSSCTRTCQAKHRTRRRLYPVRLASFKVSAFCDVHDSPYLCRVRIVCVLNFIALPLCRRRSGEQLPQPGDEKIVLQKVLAAAPAREVPDEGDETVPGRTCQLLLLIFV